MQGRLTIRRMYTRSLQHKKHRKAKKSHSVSQLPSLAGRRSRCVACGANLRNIRNICSPLGLRRLYMSSAAVSSMIGPLRFCRYRTPVPGLAKKKYSKRCKSCQETSARSLLGEVRMLLIVDCIIGRLSNSVLVETPHPV